MREIFEGYHFAFFRMIATSPSVVPLIKPPPRWSCDETFSVNLIFNSVSSFFLTVSSGISSSRSIFLSNADFYIIFEASSSMVNPFDSLAFLMTWA